MTIKRIHYPKSFKQKALAEVSKGVKFEDVLKSNGYDITFLANRDKKYCAKLLSKWRKEIYQNSKLSHIVNNKTDLDSLLYEIEILKRDNEIDVIMRNMKDKMLNMEVKREKLKQRILQTYQNKKNNFKNKSLKNRFDK